MIWMFSDYSGYVVVVVVSCCCCWCRCVSFSYARTPLFMSAQHKHKHAYTRTLCACHLHILDLGAKALNQWTVKPTSYIIYQRQQCGVKRQPKKFTFPVTKWIALKCPMAHTQPMRSFRLFAKSHNVIEFLLLFLQKFTIAKQQTFDFSIWSALAVALCRGWKCSLHNICAQFFHSNTFICIVWVFFLLGSRLQ